LISKIQKIWISKFKIQKSVLNLHGKPS